MDNYVDNFLAQLELQTPKSRSEQRAREKSIEKIYLNFPGNFGKYQVFPMNYAVTHFPFVSLQDTKEICIPRKPAKKDESDGASDEPYSAWIKLLPKHAYVMKDSTGRVVSSLSAADEELLNTAYSVYNQLCEELDVKNNATDPIVRSLVRKRNYTLFHASCINKWENNSRTPVRQNFTGLFVCTTQKFMTSIQLSLKDKEYLEGGNNWVEEIYNDNLTGRTGFLMFTIELTRGGQPGYNISVQHEIGRGHQLEGLSIPADDAELMTDPVASFLGWQANKDTAAQPGYRRLFNASLIREAIDFMTSQIAAIRLAKQRGISIEEAIRATNAQALDGIQSASMSEPVDPMVDAPVARPTTTANTFSERNTDPFSTPPAAHLDPISGSPSAPFEKPDFSFSSFGGNAKDDLPF